MVSYNLVKRGLSLCNYTALIEMQINTLSFVLFFEDVTCHVYVGANKATKSQQTAGLLRGEDVAGVTLIASNDIPAEVINCI